MSGRDRSSLTPKQRQIAAAHRLGAVCVEQGSALVARYERRRATLLALPASDLRDNLLRECDDRLAEVRPGLALAHSVVESLVKVRKGIESRRGGGRKLTPLRLWLLDEARALRRADPGTSVEALGEALAGRLAEDDDYASALETIPLEVLEGDRERLLANSASALRKLLARHL